MNTALPTEDLARRLRLHVLRMTSSGKSSHIGSCFSIADIVAVLYGEVLRHQPANPTWQDRDRFILSKGHAGAIVYAALAETGYFPLSRLADHFQNGSDFCGHVSHKGIPGVELSTGSLGHGLSVGSGMAYARMLAGQTHRVFTILSDGECDEGSTWEAAMFAAHHKLDSLVAIIDYNKIQSLGTVPETLELEPFRSKWEGFGWAVHEVDGHDHAALRERLAGAPFVKGQPSCLICHTTKGKGVSFMENTVLWHYRTAQGTEYDAALKELDGCGS